MPRCVVPIKSAKKKKQLKAEKNTTQKPDNFNKIVDHANNKNLESNVLQTSNKTKTLKNNMC